MKKIMIGILFIIVMVMFAVFMYKGHKDSVPTVNPINDINESEISSIEIMVISLENYVTFHDKDMEEISEVMSILKNVEAKHSKYEEKEGCGVDISIIMKDGTKHSYQFSGEDLFVDGVHYTPNTDYTEQFRNMVNKYSERNPVAHIKEEEISFIEINTSTNINTKIDEKEHEKISEIMFKFKEIEVKAIKYPVFQCDTELKIAMKDGTEYIIMLGTQDMSVDGKYYRTDGDYKKVINNFVN